VDLSKKVLSPRPSPLTPDSDKRVIPIFSPLFFRRICCQNGVPILFGEEPSYPFAMKILYAIQGTGNGHVSRARHLLPHLQKFGEVEVLISGTQVEVELAFPVKHRYKGFSFAYNAKGGVAFARSARDKLSGQLLKEILHLPVRAYDLVINDFEPVSAWAARFRGVPCISLGHQAAFRSAASPRPEKREPFGEMVLKHYAPSDVGVGFHFKRYDDCIFPPIIRSDIREQAPINQGHYAVYLPAFSEARLLELLHRLPRTEWQVFSRRTSKPYRKENVLVQPVDAAAFTQSLLSCAGVLTGAGFETPAEAMFLGKKLLVIPIRKQYEQACNAAALQEMGIPVARRLDDNCFAQLQQWVAAEEPDRYLFPDATEDALERVLELFEVSNAGKKPAQKQTVRKLQTTS
jgi:uncharacterized protein (TIGR00661 family)